jgi:hypothetical protein
VDTIAPRYEVGEFVVCLYDFLDFFAYIYDDIDESDCRHYGIIVRRDCELQHIVGEHLYIVLCLDGETRYFLESEIKLAACR